VADESGRGRSGSAAERRARIADAALEVLGTKGSRGLTHRAVDEAAGLPLGSTSNHFRTRPALLEAAARRHVELDIPPPSELEAMDPPEGLEREQAVALVMAALDRILDRAARPALIARYELTLEATRSTELETVMATSRWRVTGVVETLLRGFGCESPGPHAAQLVTLMDGITADALQATGTALDRDAIEATIDRFLRTC
jgi:DNA-binding transcriptional regulator YbjK